MRNRRALQMRVLQAAALEERFAEIDSGKIGIGEIQLLQRGLAKRQAAQMRANQQGFDKAQAQRGTSLEIRIGQLAAMKRRRRELRAPPAGVVQVARLERRIDQIGGREIRLTPAATD